MRRLIGLLALMSGFVGLMADASAADGCAVRSGAIVKVR